jgi:pilus assembly protein CpaE
MMSSRLSVEIKTRDAELKGELKRLVLVAGGLRILESGNKERSDLLIFELSEKFEDECKQLQSLLGINGIGEVFLTSKSKNADLLLKALKTGAKAFFPQPLDRIEVSEALASFKKRIKQSTMNGYSSQGQIIHVMGAKGGVGTTTVAVNLALILAGKTGAGSVALMDMNRVFGEVPLFLALKPAYDWGRITENIKRLDATFLMNVLTKHPSGVHILPSPSYLNGHPPATSEIMESLLELMQKTFDYVIVDGGQSLDGPSLKVMEMSQQVLLITLLSLPCLSNTNKLLRSLGSLGVVPKDRVKIVINRFLKKSDISLDEAKKSIKIEISWLIPNDYKTTMSAINKGKALCNISPKAPITRNLTELAESLLAGRTANPDRNKKGKGLFSF